MPALSNVATYLIGYRAINDDVLTPAQIMQWYDTVNPEKDLRDLEEEFGHVHIMHKSWRRNGRLILTIAADSVETLLKAFDHIADPDQNGNYPVDINGRSVLIAGQLLEEIE
uniref:Uncharacterized protein n=1 Tax=viral metagenome TaxID=1070528 RepID=A0A6C0CLK3_9ZZZZ